MTIPFIITIFLIGFVGSFLSGMMGIGGAIVKYPMLLFIPALLGFAAFTPHEVSGITAVEVFFASLSGVLAYRKSNLILKPLVLYMGISVLVGSVIGGAGSQYAIRSYRQRCLWYFSRYGSNYDVYSEKRSRRSAG